MRGRGPIPLLVLSQVNKTLKKRKKKKKGVLTGPTARHRSPGRRLGPPRVCPPRAGAGPAFGRQGSEEGDAHTPPLTRETRRNSALRVSNGLAEGEEMSGLEHIGENKDPSEPKQHTKGGIHQGRETAGSRGDTSRLGPLGVRRAEGRPGVPPEPPSSGRMDALMPGPGRTGTPAARGGLYCSLEFETLKFLSSFSSSGAPGFRGQCTGARSTPAPRVHSPHGSPGSTVPTAPGVHSPHGSWGPQSPEGLLQHRPACSGCHGRARSRRLLSGHACTSARTRPQHHAGVLACRVCKAQSPGGVEEHHALLSSLHSCYKHSHQNFVVSKEKQSRVQEGKGTPGRSVLQSVKL